MVNIHELKILEEFFSPVVEGKKTFEVRRKDREFHYNDYLLMRMYDIREMLYKSHYILAKIIYILDNPKYVKEGFIILGIEVLDSW